MTLEVSDLTVRLRQRTVLDAISFTAQPKELIALIGPNGSGKTTLLRAVQGLIAFEGTSSVASLPEPIRARTVSWLPQQREIAWGMTVHDVVSLSRIAAAKATAVAKAISTLGLDTLAQTNVKRLSGGEQARVLLARAIAQDTPVLLADEPIAGLDPAYQLTALALLRRLAGEGKVVIVALHDLTLAARFCSRVLLLHHGRLLFDGPSEQVLTRENITNVFAVQADILTTTHGRLIDCYATAPTS